MPPRKPLDSEAKAARRRLALQKFRDKHNADLRDSARERMQRQRTLPTTETQKASKRAAAKKYREKHKESIHARDSLRRARKRREEEAALTPEESLTTTLNPVPPSEAARRHKYWEEWSPPPESEGGSDTDSAGKDNSPISGSIFYGRAKSRTPPDLHCECRLPAFCPKCTCGCDYMCCLYHHDDESEHRKWMKDLTREENMLRAKGLRPA
ncbi:hypothetical protein B0H15DRAFT_958389 [Mycena belliarum]|uniref:Uncharacterized protein n=1 Tax=Mycena belliarum TaxID=1033014 RepID=A0AAD6XDI1_9AGAR|nr:hypothetical protein B0H15DRAFT_958389 [Mycena belliae]